MSPSLNAIDIALAKTNSAMEQQERLMEALDGKYLSNQKQLSALESELQKASERQSALGDEKSVAQVAKLEKQIASMRLAVEKSYQAYDKQASAYEETQRKAQSLEEQQKRLQNATEDETKETLNGKDAKEKAGKASENLSMKLMGLSSAINLAKQAWATFKQVIGKLDDMIAANQVLAESENKLATAARHRLGLNDEQIQGLMSYAAAQQQVGIINQESVMSATSILTTYGAQESSLKSLTEAVQNLAVYNAGYNTSQSDVESAAKAVGYALNGQAARLKKLGIVLDENETEWLKTATQQERQALLLQKITNLAGGMNEAYAQTPFGQIEQATNSLNSSMAAIGETLVPLKAAFMTAFAGIAEMLVGPIQSAGQFIKDHIQEITMGIIILGAIAVGVAAAMAVGWAIANWPLVLIIATIGIVVKKLTDMGVTVEDITGFIGGLIGGLYAVVYNKFALIWNVVADFINFFANVFKDPVGAIKVLFWNLTDSIIGFVISIAGAIESLVEKITFGLVKLDLTSALRDVQAKAVEKAAAIKEEMGWKDVVEKKEYMDITESAAAGEKIGRDVGAKIEDGLSGIADMMSGWTELGAGIEDYMSDFDFDSTGALKTAEQNDIKIKDEDLKMLHDIATQQYRPIYQQLTPQVLVNIDTVRETTDINAVVTAIADGITEAKETSLNFPVVEVA